MPQNAATPSAQGDGNPLVNQPSRNRLRWKGGAAVVLIGCAGMIGAALFAPDNTFRVIFMLYAGGFLITGLSIWWLFFSGVTWKTRLGGVVALIVLLAVGSVSTIQRVEFSGDMRPRLRWRWQPNPKALTADWLSKQNNSTGTGPNEPTLTFQVESGEWSRYCGPDGNRLISDPLPANLDWGQKPPKELWRHPVGEAWSSFSVAGGRAFTQEQRGPKECVVCYDALTGQQIWVHEDEARYETAMGGIGPRATPTVTSTAVFALGATGVLNCMNPVNGQTLWTTNILKDADSQMIEWGMSGSPLLYEGLVIVDAGGASDRAVIAYKAESGEIAWSSQNHQAGYAAPRIEQFSGEDHLLIFHGEGLLSLNPSNGKKNWEYPWTNIYKINVAQPLRFGDTLLISSGYDSGCVLLDPSKLTNEVPAEIWPRAKTMKLKFNEAVQDQQYVYGLDDGILACIDARTGERKWKGGRYGFGQLLKWEDKILVQAEKGFVAIVAANPDKFEELTRFDALTERTWNVPVVTAGRLYVRNADEAACFQIAEPTASAEPASESAGLQE